MAKKRNYYNNTSTDTVVEEEVEAVVEETESETVEDTVEEEIIEPVVEETELETVEETVEEEVKPIEVEIPVPVIDTVTILPTFTAAEKEPVKVASSNTSRVFTPGEYVMVMPNTPVYPITTSDIVSGMIKESCYISTGDKVNGRVRVATSREKCVTNPIGYIDINRIY